MLDLGVPERRARQQWPNLSLDNFRHTSEPADYNCIAHAMRDNDRWWEPSGNPEHFWPDGVVKDYSLDSFKAAFRTRHYEDCADGSLETGFEKIAIYWNHRGFRHIARQLVNGHWTSKLGDVKDIEHDTLDDLAGDFYGQPTYYMRRPRGTETAQAKRRRRRRRRK